MELVGEDGNVLTVKEGHPLVLGRVTSPFNKDGSVSRHQVVLELLRSSSRKGKEVVGRSLDLKLLVRVVGRNPVCVLNRARDDDNERQDVKFLSNGQKYWLLSGDKVSLSIRRPFFYELRSEGRLDHGGAEGAALDSNLVGDLRVDSPASQNEESAKCAATDEEKGIAEAVARRQRKRLLREGALRGNLEKQQHHIESDWPRENSTRDQKNQISGLTGNESIQHRSEDRQDSLQKQPEKVNHRCTQRRNGNLQHDTERRQDDSQQQPERDISSNFTPRRNSDVQHNPKQPERHTHSGFADERIDQQQRKQEIVSHQRRKSSPDFVVDGVAEFGFIVEGSEFSGFSSRAKKLVWTPDIDDKEADIKSVVLPRVDHGQPSKNPIRSDDKDDDEWGGDDAEEKDRLKRLSRKKSPSRLGSGRSRRIPSNKKTDNSRDPVIKSSNRGDEDSFEDSDDSAGSLADFIVDDDESIENIEDVEHERKRTKRIASQSQKPECRYGSKCYRKNAEHRAQFHHPSP